MINDWWFIKFSLITTYKLIYLDNCTQYCSFIRKKYKKIETKYFFDRIVDTTTVDLSTENERIL